MPDPVVRRAAWRATFVAVPVALLIGALMFWLMSRGPDADRPTPPPPTGPAATGPVPMAAPSLAQRPAAVCRALLARLADSVRDLPRRPVTAGAEQNAAYGDPPLTLACGGARASYPADAMLWVVSTICWYAEERRDASVWTTIDREVPVTVTVPAAYAGAGDWVNEFSAALAATVPATAEPPEDCF